VNGESWYVARTKPRQEAVANGNLQRQGFATYLPKLKVLKRIRRQQVLRMEPMFPQYLFFRPAHAQHSIAPVRSTIGVLTIVRFGHQPALLSPERLDAISALEARQNESSIEELSAIQPGSRVVVVDGPLAGMEGLVSSVSAKRVEVLMHLLGSDTKVNLALASLETAR
jgi:transcriptional antiterminator RfaH